MNINGKAPEYHVQSVNRSISGQVVSRVKVSARKSVELSLIPRQVKPKPWKFIHSSFHDGHWSVLKIKSEHDKQMTDANMYQSYNLNSKNLLIFK